MSAVRKGRKKKHPPGDEVRGEPRGLDLGPPEPGAGQGEVRAEGARAEAVEEVGAADVAKEPEGRLGHRHQRALRRHAERPVHGEAAAPAHADPVDDCHVRLRQPPDQAVEVVLGAEERERVRRPPGAGPGDGRLDVPPRAERLPPRALDEDGVDVRVGIPLRVQLVQPPHHPRVDRVQLRNVTRGCTAASAHGPVSPRGFGVLRKAGSAPACPARPAAPLRRRESEGARERGSERARGGGRAARSDAPAWAG